MKQRTRQSQLITLLIIALLLLAGFALLTLTRPVAPPPAAATVAARPADPATAAPTFTPRATARPAATTGAAATTASPARSATPTARPTATPRVTATPTVRATATPTPRFTASPTPGGLRIATPLPGDRLATIRLDRLPKEAHDTIRLIARNGPFPYRQDGVVFENREGRLPRKPGGYYREYTVVTPGSSDRGARRLVRGSQEELFYTDDHYDSFRRVIP
jgi:guanyl-specific ribonuclease Sa